MKNVLATHEVFLGSYQNQIRIDGALLSELVPTVPEADVHTHTHQDGHFLLLLDGHYRSDAKGMPDICSEPTLIANPPGTTHRDRFAELAGRFFTISVSEPHWQQLAQQQKLPDYALRLAPDALVFALRLWREFRQQSLPDQKLSLQAAFFELVFAAGEVNPATKRLKLPAWLQRAHDRLTDTWRAPPSMDQLAHECDVHPVYFARAFRQRYRQSPGEYLRQVRLNAALAMLQQRNRRLIDIALDCGFVDDSHLSKCFQRQFGFAPSQLRDFRELVQSVQAPSEIPARL
jgi:AraC family transcriptional regulator